MKTLRRFLVLALLMFWLGGFTFYTAVVVPIGTEVLEGAENQGWITRRVTVQMNLAGAVALAALACDVAICGDPVSRRRWLRWLTWSLLTALLLVLFWLHGKLNALMDVRDQLILDYPRFRILHRWYLWVSTVQWVCGIAAIILMLRAWQGETRAEPLDLGIWETKNEREVRL